jgi:drug/metabolite transporter (DMT)-like permease
VSARDGDRVWLAIFLSLFAIFLFDCMGLIIKLLSPRYSAAELSAWRNLFGFVPTIIALYASAQWRSSGRPLKMRQWKLALLRGLIVSVAQLSFYLALGTLAYAVATTISFSGAIFMTVLAVPILGEKVGWVRWSAVGLGFIGVVLVVRPTDVSFSWVMLAPVLAAFMYALSGVLARLLDDDVPTALANMYSNVLAFISSLIMAAALGGFSPVASLTDLFWLLAMGPFGGAAVFCLIVAYRMTEQSNLAPFSYFGIPMSFFLGWAFFGEAPFDALFPGAILIAASGLIVVFRERAKKR